MTRAPQGTVVFSTLRVELNPTAEGVAALAPILQDAASCYPMDLVLKVTEENIEAVRQVVIDLEAGRFIGNYEMQQLVAQTREFGTLRVQTAPTPGRLEALVPILQAAEACGAADKFRMEVVLHLGWDTLDKVKRVVADLEQAGFISALGAQALRGQVERFRGVLFR